MGTTVNHPEIAVRDTPTATQERKSATTKLYEKKNQIDFLFLCLYSVLYIDFCKIKIQPIILHQLSVVMIKNSEPT